MPLSPSEGKNCTQLRGFFFRRATGHRNRFSASLLNYQDLKQMNTDENQCTPVIFMYVFC